MLQAPVLFIATLVIDISSSMFGVTQALQKGVNKYLKYLIKLVGPDGLRVSVVVFAGDVVVLYNFAPVRDVELTGNFQHGYGTALYKGALTGIQVAKENLTRCVEQPRMPKVSVAVFTDGYDTRSATSLPELQDSVKSVHDLGFDLKMIGVGIDVSRTAREMGFNANEVISVPATHRGLEEATGTLRDYPTQIFGKFDK